MGFSVAGDERSRTLIGVNFHVASNSIKVPVFPFNYDNLWLSGPKQRPCWPREPLVPLEAVKLSTKLMISVIQCAGGRERGGKPLGDQNRYPFILCDCLADDLPASRQETARIRMPGSRIITCRLPEVCHAVWCTIGLCLNWSVTPSRQRPSPNPSSSSTSRRYQTSYQISTRDSNSGSSLHRCMRKLIWAEIAQNYTPPKPGLTLVAYSCLFLLFPLTFYKSMTRIY